MVKDTVASSSHSEVKRIQHNIKIVDLDVQVKRWIPKILRFGSKKLQDKKLVEDLQLGDKKLVEDLQEKENHLKYSDFKLKSLKGKAYELFVPSIFSNIFFVDSRISESLKEESYSESVNDSFGHLDEKVDLEEQIAFRKLLEVSSTISTVDFETKKNTVKKTLTIRIKPNNVFCTLRSEVDSRIVSGSSTKYKVKMSKKTLRYNYKIVVKSFLEETKKDLRTNFLLIRITAPKRIRRELLRMLKKRLRPRDKSISTPVEKNISSEDEEEKFADILMFDFYARKCFNGCRARKKKRNKQRGLRVYK